MATETREQRRERILRERQARYDRRMEQAEAVVPHGMYCYTRVPDPERDAQRAATGEPFIPGRYVPCPYYKIRADKPEQQNGYCRLLRKGDWMPSDRGGTMLLWDGCKECGVNMPTDAEIEAEQVHWNAVDQAA
jgi:hypothetical protein